MGIENTLGNGHTVLNSLLLNFLDKLASGNYSINIDKIMRANVHVNLITITCKAMQCWLYIYKLVHY